MRSRSRYSDYWFRRIYQQTGWGIYWIFYYYNLVFMFVDIVRNVSVNPPKWTSLDLGFWGVNTVGRYNWFKFHESLTVERVYGIVRTVIRHKSKICTFVTPRPSISPRITTTTLKWVIKPKSQLPAKEKTGVSRDEIPIFFVTYHRIITTHNIYYLVFIGLLKEVLWRW